MSPQGQSGDRHYRHLRLGRYGSECGDIVDPLPEDAPFFVKDYYDYYKTDRGYHARNLNSNGGWNVPTANARSATTDS